MPAKTSAVRIAGMIEVRPTTMIELISTRIKAIAIDDSSAMRDERVVVEDGSPAVVPIESPVAKTPAETGK